MGRLVVPICKYQYGSVEEKEKKKTNIRTWVESNRGGEGRGEYEEVKRNENKLRN